MRPKQTHRRFTREHVLDIVRSYHWGGETQASLAERYGTHAGYISRLVNGQSRRDVYEQVAKEEAQNEAIGE